jgi:hypothetical protein
MGKTSHTKCVGARSDPERRRYTLAGVRAAVAVGPAAYIEERHDA